ncbi:MAG TPA: DUF192 domain-containing protein [Candidatus Cybelea sp.]|nr:DUF192 domain-containing protein [Candidatus Cybelea sp.]
MFSYLAAIAAVLATTLVHAPKANLTLEVASTEAQRERGLMFRQSLAPHTGMIFLFERDEQMGFWMKNTLIPLDMVFVASDGTVRRVFADVPVVAPNTPDDRIPQEQSRARYVIELPAGEAAADGIAAGVKLDLHGVAATPS